MDKRKKLINEYKQRKQTGGIYKITNSLNGRYILGSTRDLRAMQNRFAFSVTTELCIHIKLQEDWQEFKGKTFTFDILELIEKKEAQSQDEFIDDLQTLEEIWRGKFDASNEY